MKQARWAMFSMLVVLLCNLLGHAQPSAATATSAMVPPLIQFSNVATDEGGNSLSGVVSITFSLYSNQRGGEPLWTEAQSDVQLDATGHYSVQLGITKPNGVPTTLFTTGEARWLGVQIAEQGEQPRVLLLSVPYALKAGDAATIGGLPPSAFVLAGPQNGAASVYVAEAAAEPSVSPSTAVDVTTSGGKVNYLPLWNTTSDIINSVLFQSGTGSTAKIGINTATPASTLDINGGGTIRGPLSLLATGTATATTGTKSQPLNLAASAYNSSTPAAVSQTFRWQAEPAGNDTAKPSGTLNLLFGEGAATPAETGLHISSDGQITFAAGQTFPGGGGGAITGVTAGTDLTGGGTTGDITLNVDTTKIPQLSTANRFTANQTVDGTLTATSFAGSGSGLTNVMAANSNELDGLASNAFAQVTANNTFLGTLAVNNTTVISGTNSTGVLQVLNDATSAGSAAILGAGGNSMGVKGSGGDIGVEGQSGYIGVYGQAGGASVEGEGLGRIGVWGDTGGSVVGYAAVAGTADENDAAWFVNNGSDYITVYAENDAKSSSTALVFETYGGNFGGVCAIDVSGTLACKNPAVTVAPVDGGSRDVALYAIEGPENWFEDAGSGQLSNGAAIVSLEPVFGQTVNTEMDYHVFLTPNGDCKGLYVSQKTPTSFEVRELGGGTSSIAFDYRIMAKRKGHESVRLADKTSQFGKAAMERNKSRRAMRPTSTPQASPVMQMPSLKAAMRPVAAQPN